jgi:hypothetical protein
MPSQLTAESAQAGTLTGLYSAPKVALLSFWYVAPRPSAVAFSQRDYIGKRHAESYCEGVSSPYASDRNMLVDHRPRHDQVLRHAAFSVETWPGASKLKTSNHSSRVALGAIGPRVKLQKVRVSL